MKSKLELALEQLELKRKEIMSEKKAAGRIEALRQSKLIIERKFKSHELLISECENKIKESLADLEKATSIDVILLMGGPAEIIISQHILEDLEIESGFTAFEEIAPFLNINFVTINSDRKLRLGDFKYSIAENGLVTLIESIPDSSD